MANDRKPSQPALQAFSTRPAPTPHPPPKRSPSVLETLLEDTTARLAALSTSFDTLAKETATKEQVQEVYLQGRRTARLLEEHLRSERAERVETRTRHDAIMTMLADILARLPEPPVRQPTLPAPADTAPPSSGSQLPGFPKEPSSTG